MRIPHISVRWLYVGLTIAALLAAGVSHRLTRADSAEPLSASCTFDVDCRAGLTCTDVYGVMSGQCSLRCSSTESCRQRFGPRSLCIGADVCVRTCTRDADCPTGTRCNGYEWCERTE